VEAHEHNWLDGQRLVEWLEDRGCSLTKAVLGHHERAVRHWRDGGACSVFQADRVLTKLDIHLHEVPGHLWLEESPKGEIEGNQRRYFPEAVRREAVRRATVGEEKLKDVARSVGCSPKAVRDWIERAV
jgi:Transposase